MRKASPLVIALAGWAAVPVMAVLAFAGQSRRLAPTDVFGDPVSGVTGGRGPWPRWR
ncbi:hypothetical protein [Nonomuraea candida]|uniref:hypothetical protein n=1 Tax=Nonomuraea candida TaxID=359159 RepID=UPI0012FCCD63|nr:hypothetical protein [Nonomuraea candida]